MAPGLAALYMELGDLDAARAVLGELSRDDFRALPRDGRLATSLMFLTEVADALDDAATADGLYRLLSPWSGRNVVMGGGTGFWGAADRFLGVLAAIARRWPAAETHFLAASALNRRAGATAMLGHTQIDYARMLIRRAASQDFVSAEALLAEAEGFATMLDLPRLAWRAGQARESLSVGAPKPATPDNLTARELDVLRLMAIGRGNADIALALEIGQSTVATHVHNILGKTGCANRTEAAAYAARHRL